MRGALRADRKRAFLDGVKIIYWRKRRRRRRPMAEWHSRPEGSRRLWGRRSRRSPAPLKAREGRAEGARVSLPFDTTLQTSLRSTPRLGLSSRPVPLVGRALAPTNSPGKTRARRLGGRGLTSASLQREAGARGRGRGGAPPGGCQLRTHVPPPESPPPSVPRPRDPTPSVSASGSPSWASSVLAGSPNPSHCVPAGSPPALCLGLGAPGGPAPRTCADPRVITPGVS